MPSKRMVYMGLRATLKVYNYPDYPSGRYNLYSITKGAMEWRLADMSVKIISYDLRKPGQNYEDLIVAINNYDCCKINKSDWLIRTYASCKVVRDELMEYIDSNDTLFVAELSNKPGWWASFGLDKNAVNWLNS